MKNESLGDIALSDVKDAAVNNFKNNKPYSHQSGSESVLYKIITLVFEEAEPIRADRNYIIIVARNRVCCSFPAFN